MPLGISSADFLWLRIGRENNRVKQWQLGTELVVLINEHAYLWEKYVSYVVLLEWGKSSWR